MVDGTNVYWLRGDGGGVDSAPKGGGAVKHLTNVTGPVLQGTATSLYTYNLFKPPDSAVASWSVFQISKSTGSTSYDALNGNAVSITSLVTNDAAPFFTFHATGLQIGGGLGIYIGSSVKFRLEPLTAADACALYGGASSYIIAYYMSPGAVRGPAIMASGISPGGIALDDSYIYWSNGSAIGRIPK